MTTTMPVVDQNYYAHPAYEALRRQQHQRLAAAFSRAFAKEPTMPAVDDGAAQRLAQRMALDEKMFAQRPPPPGEIRFVAADWGSEPSKTVVGTTGAGVALDESSFGLTSIPMARTDHIAHDVVSRTEHAELQAEVSSLRVENASLHDKVASLEAALISDAALRDRIVACLNAGEARIDELLAEIARLTPVASSAPHPGAAAARAIGAVIAGWKPTV